MTSVFDTLKRRAQAAYKNNVPLPVRGFVKYMMNDETPFTEEHLSQEELQQLSKHVYDRHQPKYFGSLDPTFNEFLGKANVQTEADGANTVHDHYDFTGHSRPTVRRVSSPHPESDNKPLWSASLMDALVVAHRAKNSTIPYLSRPAQVAEALRSRFGTKGYSGYPVSIKVPAYTPPPAPPEPEYLPMSPEMEKLVWGVN